MPTLSIPPLKILYAYHADYLSMCTRFPSIFDCSFESALRFANPNLGEGEVVGVGDGTVRKSVGEFL